MRTIKFRAWDKDAFKMRDWEELLSIPEGIVLTFTGKINLVLLQFTGLKDKNGKEIYEGDVVKRLTYIPRYKKHYLHGRPFTVEWKHSRVRNGWNLGNGIYEVIGNVFQNKDLLK